MNRMDDWAHENPLAVTVYTGLLCVFVGWRLDALLIGAGIALPWAGFTWYSWTRGWAHHRYLRRHPEIADEG